MYTDGYIYQRVVEQYEWKRNFEKITLVVRMVESNFALPQEISSLLL